MTQSLANHLRLLCTFRLDGQLFGVDAIDVKEVTTEARFTRVAHAPEEVLGLVNIRGHIFLGLDLRRLLGMPHKELTQDSRLILFKPTTGNAFGMIVDSISEIRSVEPDQIEAFTSDGRESPVARLSRVGLIAAVCKLPEELLVLLNPRRFLPIVEQTFDETNVTNSR